MPNFKITFKTESNVYYVIRFCSTFYLIVKYSMDVDFFDETKRMKKTGQDATQTHMWTCMYGLIRCNKQQCFNYSQRKWKIQFIATLSRTYAMLSHRQIMVVQNEDGDGHGYLDANKVYVVKQQSRCQWHFSNGAPLLFCLIAKFATVTFVVQVILANGKNRIADTMSHKYSKC